MKQLRRQQPTSWPSRAEIEAACDRIQSAWTENERRKRNCFSTPPIELAPLSIAPLDDRQRHLPD